MCTNYIEQSALSSNPFVIDVCQNKTCSNEYITCFPYSTYIENLAVLVPLVAHCCPEATNQYFVQGWGGDTFYDGYIIRDPQAPKKMG